MTSLMNKILFAIFLTLQCIAGAQVLDKDGIPQAPSPPRLVNDFAELISMDNKEKLEQKLVAYNDSTSTQICVVTVNNIGDYSIEDYAVRLGRSWGIGQKDKDNGILILISKDDRKVDIEIGYGLEAYVTDYDSKDIINNIIVPAFKQSNYYEGIDEATNRLIAQLQGTFVAGSSSADDIPFWVWILIICIVLFIFYIIFSGKSTVSIGGGGWTWSGGGGGSSWSSGGSSSFGGFGGGSFGGGGSSGSW